MRVFVASWFFPPATSSEGIVAFKLLKASKNHYDVCSSLSKQWGYDFKLEYDADRINVHPIDTDDIEVWVEEAIKLFEILHNDNPYDLIMTRSMPPESIDVGLAIKKKHPDIPWVASLADPIARTPWMMRDYLGKNCGLSEKEKQLFKRDLAMPGDCQQWLGKGNDGVDVLCRYKYWENAALSKADCVFMPSGPQADYMLCGKRGANVHIIPHCYDESLYPQIDAAEGANSGKIELAFLGFSDNKRPLTPLIKGLHRLQIDNPNVLEKLHVRLIGNIVDDSSALIYNFNLTDVVSIEPGVNYFESLRIMKEVDWLIHTDGSFPEFNKTGGSVFLAGKLADYLGSGKPIFAMTGRFTPADRIVRQAGGFSCDAWNAGAISEALERIANHTLVPDINYEYRAQFASSFQAARMDVILERTASCEIFSSDHSSLPYSDCSSEDKVLTICVPSYNVEETLDRALYSFVSCGHAELLDVLVVNDGSSDRTKEIGRLYEDKYPGIIKLVDKENGGHGSTINTAIELARGKYFRVVDGDDWLEPKELGKLLLKLKSMEENGEKVDLVSSDYAQIDMTTGGINRIKMKKGILSYDKVYDIDKVDISDQYFSIHSITYRTEVLRQSELRLSEHAFYVDVEYQMLTLPWVKTILFTAGELYRYSVGNSGQSISKTSFVKRYDNHDRVMRRVIDFYADHISEMPATVERYYRTLIEKHFLNTHYSISLLYDEDRERGLRRTKEFDHYLKSKHRMLYEAAGVLYPTVAFARKESYQPANLPKFNNLKYRKPSVMKKAARAATKKVMRGQVGGIVASEVTRRQKR